MPPFLRRLLANTEYQVLIAIYFGACCGAVAYWPSRNPVKATLIGFAGAALSFLILRLAADRKVASGIDSARMWFTSEDMGVLIDPAATNSLLLRDAILDVAMRTPLSSFVKTNIYNATIEFPRERQAQLEFKAALRQRTAARLLIQANRPGDSILQVLAGPGILTRDKPALFYAELYDWPLASIDETKTAMFVVAYCLYCKEFYKESEELAELLNSPSSTYLIASSLLRRGEFALARDGFTNSWDRRLYPSRWARAIHNRGVAYFQEGSVPEAIADFEAALEVRTREADLIGFSYTANNLALALAQRGELDRAMQLLYHAQTALMAEDRASEASAVAANSERLGARRPSDLSAEVEGARAQVRELIGIPEGPFVRPGMRIAHRLKQATSISGDFYRIIPRKDGSIGIMLVDVEGHGLAASTNAVAIERALFRSGREWGMGGARQELLEADRVIEDELSHVDIAVCMNFLEVQPSARTVRYAGAGMPFPMLFRRSQSTAEVLIAVGMYVGAGYRRTEVHPSVATETLEDGDLIVVFSDGIPEATDSRGRVFGQDGISAAVFQAGDESADVVADSIMRAVSRHASSERPKDDQALLVVQIGVGSDEKRVGVTTFAQIELGLSPSFELLNAEDSGLFATTVLKDRLITWASGRLESEERALQVWNAAWEAIQNAIKHGSKPGDAIRIDFRAPEGAIEIVVWQPQRWPDWDIELGSRRSLFDMDTRSGLGTLIILRLADEVSVSDYGRRVHLKFYRQNVTARQ